MGSPGLVQAAVIFQLLLGVSLGIIIMDRGNPARFIRGTFMDANQVQPEFDSVAPAAEFDNLFDEDFMAQALQPGFLQTISSIMVTELDMFVKAMTNALIVEAKEVTARSAVNMCQFSRARMNAKRIMNTLQTVIVQAATLGMEGKTDMEAAMLTSVLDEVATLFAQMEQDLHQYNPATHGSTAIKHFANAAKEYTALKFSLALASLE